jgi:L-Ala-D/L-Glu epimerase
VTRITGLTLTRARLRFRTPLRSGTESLTGQDVGFLHLSTDDGFEGVGEVAGPRLPADLESTVARLSRRLSGSVAVTVDASGAGILAAALDTALLDVRGRLEGRSVADLLGGGAPDVRVNGLLTVGVGAATDVVQAAQSKLASGFRTIKVKRAVGTPEDRVGDVLRAIRDSVGPAIALRLDLNGDLTEGAAISWLSSLGELGLEYVEQPIPVASGPMALARVRAAIPMRLAADESVTDVDAARVLLETGAADVLVVKPSRVGGPRASVRIARAAAAADVAVTVSTLYDSGIGLAAALHVAATVGGDRAHGLGTAALLESDLIGGGLPIVEGRMVVPMGGGLGVTLAGTAMAEERVRA